VHRALPVPVCVDAIAERLGGTVHGDGTRRITRLASLESAGADAVSFLSGRRHAQAARDSGAGALIVSAALQAEAPAGSVHIVVADPYAGYAMLSQWFEALLVTPRATVTIDPLARIHTAARLGAGVDIGPGAMIAAGACVGAGCRIGAGCAIGEGASIGPDSVLHPNVVLYPGVTLGARAIVVDAQLSESLPLLRGDRCGGVDGMVVGIAS
jgi:UDP-3-O-[3-hydroxymyristoyl] glucosamine N-acyltransferase